MSPVWDLHCRRMRIYFSTENCIIFSLDQCGHNDDSWTWVLPPDQILYWKVPTGLLSRLISVALRFLPSLSLPTSHLLWDADLEATQCQQSDWGRCLVPIPDPSPTAAGILQKEWCIPNWAKYISPALSNSTVSSAQPPNQVFAVVTQTDRTTQQIQPLWASLALVAASETLHVVSQENLGSMVCNFALCCSWGG